MENTFLCLLLSVLVYISVPASGCTIDGLNSIVAATETILDTFKGNIWDKNTSDIEGIEGTQHADGLNKGPYVAISHNNSRLIISTNNAFEHYEEYETAMSMAFTITFTCTGGSTRNFDLESAYGVGMRGVKSPNVVIIFVAHIIASIHPPLHPDFDSNHPSKAGIPQCQILDTVFEVGIIDTNNHDPLFLPTNNYEFLIAPPIPSGFLITNCVDDIIVRDIDLTTERIDFEISGSSLFQIAYQNSTNAKEFKAALRTTTSIRSIPEPIILTVTATDVDRTGDPRRTATATVKVTADTDFTFPDEPIFSQPFYLATYTRENELFIRDSIFLAQGFDEEVIFSFDGQYSKYFELVTNGNYVTFDMKAPVPVELYREGQILLVVKAERNYTSGATATVVVQLPEVTELAFETGVYEGSIEDSILNLGDLKLKQGYEDTIITVDITSDYKSYFSASIDGNTITLSMDPLSDSVIRENNFINVQVTAASILNSTATTVVTLEIIKDDITTPVFERNIYTGSYAQETGLSLEQIVLIQGYDNTVNVTLEGEHSSLFEKKQEGPQISLSMTSVPSELLAERNILVSVRAAKPRTVGANTAVRIALPTARELRFEKFVYKGNFEENIIALETIVLNVGYDSDVIFSLTGDHADFFNLNVTKNEIRLGVKEQLPEMVVENSFLILVLSASGTNTVTATATIILEIIKQDTVTPVFSKYIYEGNYINSSYIDFETITLIQGYDDTVNFDLHGEHAKYFSINSTENAVMLTLKSAIPEDLIFNEKVLLFSVRAEKSRTVGANAAISLKFPQDLTEPTILRFSQNTYRGLLNDSILIMDNIILESGFTTETKFLLSGDSVDNFAISNNNNVISIELSNTADLEDLKNYKHIVLELEASRERAVPVISTLIIDIPVIQVIIPVFEKAFYIGTFTKGSGLEFTEEIALKLGFDETVTFELEGDNAQWFSASQDGNSVSIISIVTNPLPDEVFLENDHLLFTIIAHKADTIGGRAVISISLLKDFTVTEHLAFLKDFYTGYIENNTLTLETITINKDLTNGINLTLSGDHFNYFQINQTDTYINIQLANEIPSEIIESNNILVLALEANSATNRAHTTIIFEIKRDSNEWTALNFEHTYYRGSYSETGGFIFESPIRLTDGFDESVRFTLEGDHSLWFSINLNDSSITLLQTKEISSIIMDENRNLIFTIMAQTLTNSSTRATIIIDILTDKRTLTVLGFERSSYIGSLNKNTLELETITLTEGYTENVTFAIDKEFATYFGVLQEDATVTIQLIEPVPDEIIPENEIMVLELTASAPYSVSATTAIVLDVILNETSTIVKLNFDRKYYTGHYTVTGFLNFTQTIILIDGYDESTKIQLEGELANWFELQQTKNTAVLKLKSPVPDTILSEFQPLIFVVWAQKENTNVIARAIIIITHDFGSEVDASLSFDRILYNGNLTDGVISHETIKLTGFTGSNINISGELATSFEANVANDYVTVDVVQSALFPENLTYIALTLQADSAKAVLILDHAEPSDSGLPIVSFSSPSYFLWADTNQTGVVGRVKATVDNGESVLYSITVDDELQDRVVINTEGEIHLLASVSTGIHHFKVTATTQTSKVSATAPVLLRVDTLPECGTEDGLPPLVVLERVEEEPHLNLVVLNQTENKDCWYTMTNLWPEDQSWLYVDSRGLHAKAIDREHKSIAFMILSQIQVELILHCDIDDEKAIVKRSLAAETGSKLDPYNYGSNKWILADTIMYNARRSVVNLIVEDINDNEPIFAGKENEPIYVGYPIPELENTILPRALIELKATDADIGENAALMYWSMEENLAIAPTTGYVHVRDNTLLEDNSHFTVYATDQNGRGLNGTLDIVVKLLERNQIAVITVKNAFLDDENSILSNLSTLVGYDVKILRTVITSNNNEETEENLRRKRETVNTFGASLQLFVYGMSGNELVNVEKLMSDLDKVVSANTVRVISLEDHLEALEICPVSGLYTPLLAATIALAVILFILIVAATVWFLLKWRKTQNYEQFSDANSQNSRIEAEPIPKVESPSKPRLDIEELKRSERRLQEMLDTPIAENVVQPPKNESNQVKVDESIAKAQETLINFSVDPQQPIVIQSIDKLKDNTDDLGDDEFGEVKIRAPRKSVVTFNENVEKIIHLEYGIDDNPEDAETETEVYRL